MVAAFEFARWPTMLRFSLFLNHLVSRLKVLIVSHGAGILLLTFVVCCVYWPLLPLTKIASHLIDGDALHNAYLMNWGQRTLWLNPLGYYDAPMLYPQKTAAAFSSINLFLAFITGPLYFLQKPVFAYNAAMYLAVWLCGVSMYGCAYALTNQRRAALIAGVIYCCNGDLQFHFNGHPNVVSPIFIPPLILVSLHFARNPRGIHAPLFCGFLILQFLCDWYLGFIALIGVGVPLCWAFAANARTKKRELMIFLASFACTMGFVYWLSGPFRAVGERVGSIRGLGSHINYSASIQGYALPSFVEGMNQSIVSKLLSNTWFAHVFVPQNYRDGDSQFYGWSVYALLICTVVAAARKGGGRRVVSSPVVVILAAVGLTGFLFSLGPYLWIGNRLSRVPLPELALYEFVPPLRFMRDTSRHAVVLSAALGLLSAKALARWPQWFDCAEKTKRALLIVALGLLIFEFRPAKSPNLHAFNKQPYEWMIEDYNWANEGSKLSRVASLPLNNQVFLLQTTGSFPVTPTSYAGGIYNYWLSVIGSALRDEVSDKSLAVFAEYQMEAVMIYGQARVQQGVEHPALGLVQAANDGNYGLFRLLPDNIPVESKDWAKTFLGEFQEFPPVASQTTAPDVPAEFRIPLLSEPKNIEYHTNYGFAQNLTFGVESLELPVIRGIWANVEAKETGVDFIISKFYTRFEGQSPQNLGSIAGKDFPAWEKSWLYWDERRIPFFDSTWSEYQTIVRYIPANGEQVWVFFPFEELASNYGGERLTGLRWDCNAMPAPGLDIRINEAFIELQQSRSILSIRGQRAAFSGDQ